MQAHATRVMLNKNKKSKDEDKTQKDAVVMTEPSPQQSAAGLYQLKGDDYKFYDKDDDKTKMRIQQISVGIDKLTANILQMKKKQADAKSIGEVVDGLMYFVQNDMMNPKQKKK